MTSQGYKVVDIDYPWQGRVLHAHLLVKPAINVSNPFDRVVAGLVAVNGKRVDHVSQNDRAFYVAGWPYKFLELVANEIPIDGGAAPLRDGEMPKHLLVPKKNE